MQSEHSTGNTGYSTPSEDCVIHCLYIKNLREQRVKSSDRISGLEQQNKRYREYIEKLEKENEFLFQKNIKRLESL